MRRKLKMSMILSGLLQKDGNLIPTVRVDMLRGRKSDNHILAATHGGGKYISQTFI